MFYINYNYIEGDNFLSNESDNNSIFNPNLDSFGSIDSKNSFLNNKTKPKTYNEEKNKAFKKGKIFDEITEKSKNKDISSLNNEKECNKKCNVYRDLIVCKEILLEIMQNKKIVCNIEKIIQTNRNYEDEDEDNEEY